MRYSYEYTLFPPLRYSPTPFGVTVNPCMCTSSSSFFSQTVYSTKGTRAHTQKELIRKWLWESKGSSLEYI